MNHKFKINSNNCLAIKNENTLKALLDWLKHDVNLSMKALDVEGPEKHNLFLKSTITVSLNDMGFKSYCRYKQYMCRPKIEKLITQNGGFTHQSDAMLDINHQYKLNNKISLIALL